MNSDNLDAAVLLKHDPRHGVLICLECRYAVQRSALDSHLLRHKIYREERKRLVASVSHLDLLEPDKVLIPVPTSPALAHITKFSGLKCTVPECGHLTVSTKRMKLHWKQAHGSLDLSTRDCDLARNVTLQTFFRGNKVRYFEVESTHANIDSPTSEDTAHHHPPAGINHLVTPNEVSSSMISTGPSATLLGPIAESNMYMLRYFHHFVIATSRTLPFSTSVPPRERYWQEAFVSKALQHNWLMHGLLAISACHMAMSTNDPEAIKLHCEYEADYAARFDLQVGAPVANEAVEQIGDHIRNLLRLAQIGLRRASPTRASDYWHQRAIALHLRDCLYLDTIRFDSRSPVGESEISQVCSPTKASVEGLRTLQSRIFELLGRPANIGDALAVIKSIELLQEAYSSVGSYDDLETCWSAAADWVNRVPSRFHEMVDDLDPVALLLMAYWSTMLVTRAEMQGCWFLKGVVRALVLQVAEKLVAEQHPLLPLILDFAGD